MGSGEIGVGEVLWGGGERVPLKQGVGLRCGPPLRDDLREYGGQRAIANA